MSRTRRDRARGQRAFDAWARRAADRAGVSRPTTRSARFGRIPRQRRMAEIRRWRELVGLDGFLTQRQVRNRRAADVIRGSYPAPVYPDPVLIECPACNGAGWVVPYVQGSPGAPCATWRRRFDSGQQHERARPSRL